MGLAYQDLNAETRQFMLEELEFDVERKLVYLSQYLTAEGQARWVDLLRDAISEGSDDTLSLALRRPGLLRAQYQRRKPKGGFTLARVPHNANETLAEGEFGRYFVRGLCRRAIANNWPHLEVYRAKQVDTPRPGSQQKIGSLVSPHAILDDLRSTIGVEPLLGLPPGPNSGLTLKRAA